MIAGLIFGGYLIGALFGYRFGYVAGYEHGRREYRILGHNSWHGDGLIFGLGAGLLWPLALPLILVVKYLTPTPPSVKAERGERLIREQADEIRRLEREAGIR